MRRFTWIAAGVVLLAGGACLIRAQDPSPAVQQTSPAPSATPMQNSNTTSAKPSKEELKKRLTPEQYKVTCEAGTEPPFRNAYWNNHAPGIYVDLITGKPLFSSLDKFDSGTGWPSFTKPLDKNNVVEHTDRAYGMERTEVVAKDSDAHLGHVFDDGPVASGGLRYCMNSASLRFIPVDKLKEEGYAQFLPMFEKAQEKK